MRLAFVLVVIALFCMGLGAGGFYLKTVDLKAELAKKNEQIVELKTRPDLPRMIFPASVLDDFPIKFYDTQTYSVVWLPLSSDKISDQQRNYFCERFRSAHPEKKIIGTYYFLFIEHLALE